MDIFGCRLINGLVSSYVIFALVTLGFISVLVLEGVEINSVKADSSWTQPWDSDFRNGTLDNLEIIGSGSAAELRLAPSIPTVKWIKKTTANGPSPRSFHAMATIWGTDKVLLYGGYGGVNNTKCLNDTWIYDWSDNTWTEKKPTTSSPIRESHAIATIWGTKKVLFFGGDENYDTWVYDYNSNTWTKKNPINHPTGRGDHAMAPIWGTDKILLFGGMWGDDIEYYCDDTWVYDLSDNNWTQKTPDNKPMETAGHAMASIYGTDKVLLNGGWESYDDYCIYDWSDDNWTIFPRNHANLNESHAMASIYGTDKAVLFGGWGSFENNFTWMYDLSNDKWYKKILYIQPSSRAHHAMASVYGTNDIVLFGGEYYYNYNRYYFNDTWVLTLIPEGNNGSYVSEPYDIGPEAYFKTINWNASTPPQTSIKFQLRSATNESELNLKDFVGPDGSTFTYYIYSSSKIWPEHNNDRWIQYKVYLESTEIDLSPILYNISISYNCIPGLDNPLVTPQKGDITNQFNFTINYLDRDNDPPAYIWINIDGINYTMEEGNGTDRLFLDGKSYWYSTKLNSGNHSYQFFTSDGEAKRATEMKHLNIDFGPIDHIKVEPAFAKITTDEYQKFTAKCYDVENNLLQITPTWAANGGGSIDQTGNFTATTPGEWTVFANYSGLSGSARIIVIPGKLHQIIISPQEPTITTDEYQLFTATGYDADKNILPISPTWAISGGGIIDQTGNYTASTPGLWKVYANQSGISGNTTINVTPGKLNQIIITPQYPTITTDEIQLFIAAGYDADMNELSILPNWEVSGGGTIDQSGNFIATMPGLWIVYANQSGISGNTIISVTPGAPHIIIISPQYAEINVSETFVFIAKVFDADKNELDIIPSWEVTGGGTIDNNGRFTATKPGIWIIYANSSSISANATIKVLLVENNENIPSEEEENEGGKIFTVGFGIIIFIIIIILIFTFVILFKKKFRTETHKENEKAAEVNKPLQPQQLVASPVTIIKPSSLHTSSINPTSKLTPTPLPIPQKPLSLPGFTPAARTTQPSKQTQGAPPPMENPIQSRLSSKIPRPLLPPASETNTSSNSTLQE